MSDEYKDMSLVGLANGIYIAAQEQGIFAGWREAAKYLRALSGEEYAAGRDVQAKQIREVAVMLEKKAKEVETHRDIELARRQDGCWDELAARDEEDRETIGEAQP